MIDDDGDEIVIAIEAGDEITFAVEDVSQAVTVEDGDSLAVAVEEPESLGVAVESGPELSVAIQDGETSDPAGVYFAEAVGSIGGGRVVRRASVGVVYADASLLANSTPGIGVSEHAAADGGLVAVRHYGELSDPAWSWTPGQPIYLGSNGVMIQTVPAGNLVVVARAVTTQMIFVDPQPPILLAN